MACSESGNSLYYVVQQLLSFVNIPKKKFRLHKYQGTMNFDSSKNESLFIMFFVKMSRVFVISLIAIALFFYKNS